MFDRRKLEQGNQLFLFTMKVLELCEQYKVPYVLENPLTSFAWSMPPLVQFQQHHQSQFCDLDFCMFGEPWKKPTRLMLVPNGHIFLERPRCRWSFLDIESATLPVASH